MDGFQVGSTTNSCTKGIWIWSSPIETTVVKNGVSQEVSVIILDCEGSGSIGNLSPFQLIFGEKKEKIFTNNFRRESYFGFDFDGSVYSNQFYPGL